MNTVRAGVRGVVREIRARDGALVEYGETLLRVDPREPREHPPHAHRQSRRDRGAHHRAPAAQLGIETVLAASEADRDSLPARLADRARVHRRRRGRGELSAGRRRIVQAALGTGCDAIHPGYGFLSERAAFAQLCEQHGVDLHRPHRGAARRGGRQAARARRGRGGRRAGGAGRRGGLARGGAQLARSIGVPLLIKAVGGGGGRGMKRVERAQDLDAALELAAAEAGAAFGDARVYLERFVARGAARRGAGARRRRRAGDPPGRTRLLGAAPLPEAHRGDAGARTVDATCARACTRPRCASPRACSIAAPARWSSWSTRERDEFYFLEMNARIQVEHPVTEVVTGVDLVAEQIADRRRARACACAQADVRCAAAPSSAASMPRIRRAISAQPGHGDARRAGRAGDGHPRRHAHRVRRARAAVLRFAAGARSSRTGRIAPPRCARLRAALAAHAHRRRRHQSRLPRRGAGGSGVRRAAASTPATWRASSSAPGAGRSARMAEIATRRDLAARRQPDACGARSASTPRKTLSIAPVMDRVGFKAIDFTTSTHMGVAVRYKREDPWERIRLMAAATPNTPLQFMSHGIPLHLLGDGQPGVHGAGVRRAGAQRHPPLLPRRSR